MNAPVDVLGRAASLLRTVSAQEPAGTTTADIARASGIARPTTHRLLSALAAEGLLDRDPDGRWHLGPETYLLGTVAAPRYDATDQARPALRRLAAETGESAFFSVRRGNETVCLAREEGSFPIRSHVLHEGLRLPLGVASAGLAILAHADPAEVDKYLSSTELSVVYGAPHSEKAVRERVAATRHMGYAVNPGLLVEGSWGMAAAVFDRQSRPIAALSLTGVEHRFSPDRRPELGRLLLNEALRLTSSLRR